jgi:hypothetical protein
MVKFYRFLDDYNKKTEYDFVITGIKAPSTSTTGLNYSDFHIWRGEIRWTMQFIASEDFKIIVKPKFRDSIEEVSKIPLEEWMKKFLFHYIFAEYKNYEQIKKLIHKYRITVNKANNSERA